MFGLMVALSSSVLAVYNTSNIVAINQLLPFKTILDS